MRKFLVLFALGMLGAGLLATTGSAGTTSGSAGSCGAQALGNGRIGGVIKAQEIASSGSCAVHNAGDPFSNGDPPLIWWPGDGLVRQQSDRGDPDLLEPARWRSSDEHRLQADRDAVSEQCRGRQWDEHERLLRADRVLREQRKHQLPGQGRHADRRQESTAGQREHCRSQRHVPDLRGRHRLQRVHRRRPDHGRDPASHHGRQPAAERLLAHLRDVHAEARRVLLLSRIEHQPQRLHDQPSGDRGLLRVPQHDGPELARLRHDLRQHGLSDLRVAGRLHVRQRRRGFLGGLQSPNHNLDADTEISPTSHEIIEAITDPNVYNGWYDDFGFEIGDDCAYVWGATAGKFGQEYNQVINGQTYLTQEELSNKDFADTGGGCVPTESAAG